MDFGTDLALERKILLESSLPEGVQQLKRGDKLSPVTEIRITDKSGEEALGKPVGRYITVDVPPFSADCELYDGRLDILSAEIRSLVPRDGTVLAVGLGNRDMTADALGPLFAESVFATRHIGQELQRAMDIDSIRSVAAFSAGVLGRTGIESFEIIESLASKIKPSCIIAVDALAALDIRRLGTTVQLSDTGITPGSGVGNGRHEISRSTLGIPVIAIGVPTVISAYTVAKNINDELHARTDMSAAEKYREYIVASRDADIITKRAARLVSLAVNIALQPSLSPRELAYLSG